MTKYSAMPYRRGDMRFAVKETAGFSAKHYWNLFDNSI